VEVVGEVVCPPHTHPHQSNPQEGQEKKFDLNYRWEKIDTRYNWGWKSYGWIVGRGVEGWNFPGKENFARDPWFTHRFKCFKSDTNDTPPSFLSFQDLLFKIWNARFCKKTVDNKNFPSHLNTKLSGLRIWNNFWDLPVAFKSETKWRFMKLKRFFDFLKQENIITKWEPHQGVTASK